MTNMRYGRIKAIQNLFIEFVANLDILDHGLLLLIVWRENRKVDGATFYAFSVSVTNTTRLKAMQYPRLVK